MKPVQTDRNIDPQIFFSVLAFLLVILGLAIANIEFTSNLLLGLQDWIVESFAWLFTTTITALLAYCCWLALSRFGSIRLGSDDSRPEFSLVAWVSMLFSAGMGIGLVFYGVAEPVLHFLTPPNSVPPESVAAARQAMRLSIFHWGLHAWGIYVVLGLALAYIHFRKQQPLAIRSILSPLLGRHTHAVPGKLIDSIAVLGTLFGLATSLGLGAAQINAGLDQLWGIENSVRNQVIIIVLVTACAATSLVLGLHNGIRRLSEFNLVLAAILLLTVLLCGPTAVLLRGLPDHLGNYVQGLAGLSLRADPFQNLDWQKSWTIFYWAWWLSWAPFVGTFIARISRGRTIREFVIWVLIVPTLMSILWFGVFGASALRIEIFSDGTAGLADSIAQDAATAIYVLLDTLPFSALTSVVAIVLVTVFFITSSDSGSFVVDMLTSGGNPNPKIWQRIFWACMEGALAILLLLIGGLGALQAGAISLGLPFCLIMISVMFCLRRMLLEEPE